ncbi:hypothetical protein JRI60_47000 [Archangium violaceum]|uniref:LA_2272 family surface repeat-containing protein n=1 Tax=Archangium violaceum TaxID=83451 RepID=UPI0019512C02|nr:hypothetical protein [Archangium violaceum]QRN96474.1 hypothetical protein JRI60_47000 [Archangium violaceum]
MKLEVSVCAGVMAAMVGFSAGAEQPEPAPLPATVEASQQAPAQDVHMPVNLSILPGISTNGFTSGNVVNNLSIGLLATHAGRVDGLATSIVGNWVDRELRGAEFAVVANYAGQVKGAQASVITNVAGGSMRGLQAVVGVNVAAGEMVGAQLSSGVNIASGETRGLQAAVGLNIAPAMTGMQLSTGVSLARSLDGVQLSLLNVGGDVNGAQVGLVNIARRMKGLQLGLLNVAGEAEGAPIGLLSIVGNGQFHLQAWASDVMLTNVALKIGGKNVHTLLTVGMEPGREGQQRRWSAGLGLGGHIPFGGFFVDVDAIASSLREGNFLGSSNDLLAQLRLVGGWQLASHLAVFGGVTANTLISFQGEGLKEMDRFGLGRVYGSEDTSVRLWPGLVAGIQI